MVSISTSSCVDSNDPYFSNRCNGFNDLNGCNGPNGYNGHHGCTGHKGSEGHNGYTGLFDNIDLSERPEILTKMIIRTLLRT